MLLQLSFRMKIAINTQHLLKGRLEGIGWVAHEIISRMVKNHPEHEFLFIFDRPWDDDFIYADNVTPVCTKIPSRHPFLWLWHYEIDTPAIIKKYKPDIYFSPDGWMPLSLNIPVVDIVHDINFMHRPKDFPFFYKIYYRYFFPKFAKKASRVITVSHFSKSDLVEQFNVPEDKITVIHNGCDEIYRPIPCDVKNKIREKFTGGAPYFINIGSQNPRKNISGLIRGFDEFKKNNRSCNYKLLLVGKPMWNKFGNDRNLKSIEHRDDIIFTGHVSLEILHLLLGSAEALAFVSFFEGFGLPIIEAMNCDVPIICSNTTSMPEVAGDAAFMIDPNSISAIAYAMREITTNEELRKSLIKKGAEQRKKFSWDVAAETTWNAIMQSMENGIGGKTK